MEICGKNPNPYGEKKQREREYKTHKWITALRACFAPNQ